MKIFRAKNDVSPMDKATLRELKAKLDKAVGKSEAEFKAAQKQYDDFVAKLKFDKPAKKTPEEAWSHFTKKNCKAKLIRK